MVDNGWEDEPLNRTNHNIAEPALPFSGIESTFIDDAPRHGAATHEKRPIPLRFHVRSAVGVCRSPQNVRVPLGSVVLEVFEALLKAVLIVVGILALIGGGLCVATNLALMPNAIIIVIALGVAVGGGALIWWVVNRQRTKEREGNAKPPHDHPDADQ